MDLQDLATNVIEVNLPDTLVDSDWVGKPHNAVLKMILSFISSLLIHMLAGQQVLYTHVNI